MLHSVEWVFFDLGSTLIDETEADRRRIREMIRRGLPGDGAAIAFFGLRKAPWHNEEERSYPDVVPALSALKDRGFRLGVIANQNPGTERRLSDWGMLTFFDCVAASAERGTAKPDPALFRWALSRAGCPVEHAVMVGDRLDNDIAPANRLGMHSVRLLRGLGALHEPQCADERPEHTIRTLSELPELLADGG